MRKPGRTTNQMLSAPKGALYIWCNSNLEYPHRLALALGRSDLRIVRPSYTEDDRFLGRTFPAVVVDHNTTFTDRQWDGFDDLLTRVKPETNE